MRKNRNDCYPIAGSVNGDGDFELSATKQPSPGFQGCFVICRPRMASFLNHAKRRKFNSRNQIIRVTEDFNLLSMNALNMMASRIVKFNPLIFSLEIKQGYPLNNQLRWAKKLACTNFTVIIDLKR